MPVESTTVGLPIVTAERKESRHAQNKGKPLKFSMIIGSGTRLNMQTHKMSDKYDVCYLEQCW